MSRTEFSPQFALNDSPTARLDRVEAFSLGTRDELTQTITAIRQARSLLANRGNSRENDAAIAWFERNLMKPGRLPRISNDALNRSESIGKQPNQITRMSDMIAATEGTAPLSVRFRARTDDTIIVVNRDIKIVDTPDEMAIEVRKAVRSILRAVEDPAQRNLIMRLAMSYFPEQCDDEVLSRAKELLHGTADIEHRNGLGFLKGPSSPTVLFKRIGQTGVINGKALQAEVIDIEDPIDFAVLATKLVEALGSSIRVRRDVYLHAAKELRVKDGTHQRIRVCTCVELLKALEAQSNSIEKKLKSHYDSLVTILKNILTGTHDGEYLTLGQYNEIMEPQELVQDIARRCKVGSRNAGAKTAGLIA